ncbi:hypothetical protein BCV70DRAFT_120096 [Testicularia cyperi]|uniref:C2H2-type domain-containing protein n=1 Tax=Testicularia cyperi TaxID=1882483 RepID=A0A317XNX6_9BASI|nr:hypothetical protein BCV70DRAFT_120096 [Testicularia cyperi]
MQSDYFGPSADPEVGSVRPRPDSPTPSGPARKVQKRASADSTTSNTEDKDDNASNTADTTGGAAPNGPPFICPTCSTSYSRLEYLRRHERRHADIRPFVCDCGKGFSRSDVLSRHKRQCRVVLQLDGSAEGDKPAAEGEAPPKAAKPRRSSSTAKPGRPKGSTKAAKAAAAAANANGNHAADNSMNASDADVSTADGPAPPPPAPTTAADHPSHDAVAAIAAAAAAAAAAHTRQQQEARAQEQDASEMIDPAIAADSQAQAAAAATTAAAISSVAAYQYANPMDPPDFHTGRGAVNPYASAPFPHAPVHSAIAALHPQFYQPSSPESSASRSEHGSPRYASQGLVRHGSNPGSRFMRPSGYDQYATRPMPSGSTFGSATDAALWEGLDTAKLPSPGHVTTPGSAARATAAMLASLGFPVTSPLSHLGDRSRTGSHLGGDASYFRSTAPGLSGGSGPSAATTGLAAYGGSSGGNSSGFSFGNDTSSTTSNAMTSSAAGASGVSQGTEPSGATTPKEPVRFSVSTLGPLSPFSNTALNSSMSPYLSAFSNARDTPLVSSPRSAMPGTPGGGLSSLDLGGQWTGMRPPSRTVSRHNSLQGINISSTSTSPQSDGASKLGKSASTERLTLNLDKSIDSDDSKAIASSASLATTAISAPTASAATTAAAPTTVGASTTGSTSTVASTSTGTASRSGSTISPSSTSITTPSNSGVAPTVTSTPAQALVASGVSSSGIHTPSRFVKNESQQYFDGGALTPGPEAFLLRLQGGAQELRAGIHGTEISFLNSSCSGLSSLPMSTPQFSTPGWDANMFSSLSNSGGGTSSVGVGLGNGIGGGVNGTPGGAQMSALGWLMSPSIQQLLSALGSTTAGSGTVDLNSKSDYFNSKAVTISATSADAIDSLDLEVRPRPLEKALVDCKNPFYLPPEMFRACYSIPHWSLPPISRLSVLALHAQQNLLKHFPILHEPTFRIDSTPGCIAFAICMLGGHEAGRKWWAGEEVVPKSALHILNSANEPDKSNLFNQAVDQGPSRFVDEEDGEELVKPIVMTEKTDMLMRMFASRCKSVKDKCSVVQSLMLFQGHNFLSSDAATRAVAGVSHGTVVALARQAGFFDPSAEHTKREVTYTVQDVTDQVMRESSELCFSFTFLPWYLPSMAGEESIWRRWAELEGRRRTAFGIYVMDTIAHLDASVPTLLATEEVCHLPLPSPDCIWRAATAESWRKTLDSYHGPTLDEALQQLTTAENPSPLSGGRKLLRSIYGSHGPFARLVMMIALLRGIIEMLEGRATRVSKPSSLTKWLRRETLAMGRTAGDAQVVTFKRALSRWRKAWDEDPTCRFASTARPGHAHHNGSAHATASQLGAEGEALLNGSLFTPLTASGATPLSDDALPLYWLGHVLVTHAASNQKLPLRSPHGPVVINGDLRSAERHSTGGGPPMPDFRAMLRFAKNFVTRGEK